MSSFRDANSGHPFLPESYEDQAELAYSLLKENFSVNVSHLKKLIADKKILIENMKNQLGDIKKKVTRYNKTYNATLELKENLRRENKILIVKAEELSKNVNKLQILKRSVAESLKQMSDVQADFELIKIAGPETFESLHNAHNSEIVQENEEDLTKFPLSKSEILESQKLNFQMDSNISKISKLGEETLVSDFVTKLDSKFATKELEFKSKMSFGTEEVCQKMESLKKNLSKQAKLNSIKSKKFNEEKVSKNVKLDDEEGSAFLKNARKNLSYDAFNAFLKTMKLFWEGDYSKNEALNECTRIFSTRNRHLYNQLEVLLK